jgi:hypothetical protein
MSSVKSKTTKTRNIMGNGKFNDSEFTQMKNAKLFSPSSTTGNLFSKTVSSETGNHNPFSRTILGSALSPEAKAERAMQEAEISPDVSP